MTNNKTIYQVDAFTEEVFKGNPAGVMIVDESVSSQWMQNMAKEMNLSETAFVIPKGEKFQIRYFTPTKEVPLCGHATLASSHIIYQNKLKKEDETIEFEARGGNLTITKEGDWIKMVFPKYPLNKIDIPTNGFKTIVGFQPLEVYTSKYNWVVAVAENELQIVNASPNFEQMKTSAFSHLMVTAKSDSYPADFVVRCFVPGVGINEDPVTGSAHCALTPLWAEKLGKAEMDSLQLSKRTGKLKVKLADNKVEIKGKALTVFEAKVKV
ncbi:PhzF family phenazine biosynthesis protein [Galbibacter sp. EGI 63066]|uniref:PhzF family phenazine biosynthesis protein n=1 Tax=Galbibacter sp. EGI 63066 TaxID=2993559 RepID=UPI00224997A2|nr:PhzF family phenazine biosynthesis protein [Galbibacter sp. EGI 63066]MCX2679913.1 PhzF family phenazine biosynthesis protein [Galbibacter sp. EGI 63066]